MRKLVLAVALVTAACAGRQPASSLPTATLTLGKGASAEMIDRLYFGTGIPGGGEVSEEQWNAFVTEVITPRFPDGLTLYRANGQWRGPDGKIVQERSIVLEVMHPLSAETDSALAQIARTYKQRFKQDAVLQQRTPAEVKFYE